MQPDVCINGKVDYIESYVVLEQCVVSYHCASTMILTEHQYDKVYKVIDSKQEQRFVENRNECTSAQHK